MTIDDHCYYNYCTAYGLFMAMCIYKYVASTVPSTDSKFIAGMDSCGYSAESNSPFSCQGKLYQSMLPRGYPL